MRKSPPATPAPATEEEISEALSALTDGQLVRLKESASFMHKSLGTRGAGRNEGDLLSDAIIAVLEGRRRWIRANVEIVPFIVGVMKSLASHIRDGKPLDAFDEIAPCYSKEDDETEGPAGRFPTQDPTDPETELLAQDLDKQIRDRFDDDPVALLVYESFLDKMTPAEVQSCLGIDEKEYNAAAKRLRRATRTLAKGKPR